MRLMVLGASSVMVLATMYGCATTEQSLRAKGLVPQTQKELEERYSRPVKVRFDNNVGGRGTATYTPDGTARVEWPGGGDTGKWRISDGKVCVKWMKIRDGQEGCFASYKTGAKEYMTFTPDGTLNATATEVD
jgi:hypothetical protein